jgi:hypothetical protein
MKTLRNIAIVEIYLDGQATDHIVQDRTVYYFIQIVTHLVLFWGKLIYFYIIGFKGI